MNSCVTETNAAQGHRFPGGDEACRLKVRCKRFTLPKRRGTLTASTLFLTWTSLNWKHAERGLRQSLEDRKRHLVAAAHLVAHTGDAAALVYGLGIGVKGQCVTVRGQTVWPLFHILLTFAYSVIFFHFYQKVQKLFRDTAFDKTVFHFNVVITQVVLTKQ